MQFRTIHAKYPGICNRCNGPIAVGQSIRYGGPRRLYHFAQECPKGSPAPTGADYADTADDSPTDDQVFMSAAIAGNLKQNFTDLLARPTSGSFDPFAEPEPEPAPQPEPDRLTFTTIAGATVTTAPTPIERLAEADAQYYNRVRNTAPITPSAVRATQATRQTTIARPSTLDTDDLF